MRQLYSTYQSHVYQVDMLAVYCRASKSEDNLRNVFMKSNEGICELALIN